MSRTKRITPRHWLRHPRTAQEIRENAGARQDGIPVRRARKGCKPPTAWDDQVVAARYETDHKTKKRPS